MRKLYELIKEEENLEIKILTAIFDHQGQVKRMLLFQYIKKFNDIDNSILDIEANKMIKLGKIRMDLDTTVRINVSGFTQLKDYFLEKYPKVEELSPEEVIVRVFINSECPILSKTAGKLYKRKRQYVNDLNRVNACLKEIRAILDRYQLTTEPLKDPNNDLMVSDAELVDTATTRIQMEKWKEQLPKSMKLAFKLQLRKYGDDKVLKALYDEIYQYEKWNLKIKYQ